jgi:hypothetical protein
VLLTRVGGGTFVNVDEWIDDAIVRALAIVALNLCLDAGPLVRERCLSHQSPLPVHYAKCPPHSDFSATRRCGTRRMYGQCVLSALRLLALDLVERFAGTLLTFLAAARACGRSIGRTSNVRPTGASMLTSASKTYNIR